MAISEACKFEIHEEVNKYVETHKVSKRQAFRQMSIFFREMVGIEVKEETIRSKYYRGAAAVANGTPESINNQPVEIDTSPSKEIPVITENTTVNDRPRCRLCQHRLVELSSRTKKPVPSGLCGLCRKEESVRKKNDPPEIDGQQQAVWEKINKKIMKLVEFICKRTRSPIIIPDSLRSSLNSSFSKLDSLNKTYLNGG